MRGPISMDNMKLPIALVLAMAVQLTGGVWWVSQQAATIATLEETVSELGSKMAIEDAVNTKRDVDENNKDITRLYSEVNELWEDVDGMSMHMLQILELKQRIAVIEKELMFLEKEHLQIEDPRK